MTLKEARRRAGLSQCQLAALAGVTQSMICKIECYGNRPSPRVAEKIAAALNITARYVGEEPASQVTGLYNQIMCEQLPKAGIECVVVPRKEANGKAISASTVRQCLQSGDWDTLETLLPKTSLDYFRSPEAEPVLARIRNAGNVVHY